MGVYIVTRPHNDAEAVVERLKALGHAAIASPLMHVEDMKSADIPSIAFQAVLVTSANGVRSLARHAAFARISEALAITVGKASAAAARAAGFERVIEADGNVAGLIAAVKRHVPPDGGPLLYASGRQTTGDITGALGAAGYAVHRAMLYEAVPAETLPDAARDVIVGGQAAGVLIYSPRTARIWCRLVVAAGLVDRIVAVPHFCLSGNVKTALRDAGCGKLAALVAARPDEAALFKLISDANG
jgi:uroporphyrinogen-III synthase